VRVLGLEIDPETRCAHYAEPADRIALRFGCCGEFAPCFRCHEAVADHEPEPWPADRFDEPAVLCGACGTTLTVDRYLGCDDACPACGAGFNPGCRAHYGRYFEGFE